MRKICIYIISSLILLLPVAGLAFTVGTSGSSDLGSTDFMFNASQFFPTAGKDGKEPAKGLDNIDEILKLRTPVLVILMASIATLMVIAGGITLVAATGKADLAEKAKGIITTALIALVAGLCAYVMIAVLGNFIDV